MNSKQKLVSKLASVVIALCLAGGLWLVFARRSSSSAAAPQETLRRELVQKDGRWYRRGETHPFTGTMADYSPGGARLSLCQVSNGLLNGLSQTWYTNGQLEVSEHFKDGVSDGFREKWYPNGTRLSQATIVEGKVTGTFQSWHDNGQLSEQIEMKLGKPDGIAWAYYPSGFLKAETTVQEGQILERKLWKDGERRLVR
jgi:antitoxin component YwqK of YwqJK toxin-antitoxin module